MQILVIGGTVFLGRHFVQAALEAGHNVTLFHRGKSNPDLFPDIEHIHGDRRSTDDLDQLKGKTWDLLVDPSAYFPKDVELLLERTRDSIKHYTIVSSISVYSGEGTEGPDEESPVGQLIEEMPRDRIIPENYGPLKAAAEEKAEEMMPGNVLRVRPGLIVGPHDPSDRFTYWPWRINRGGEFLAPGDPKEEVQFIDVRDLAEWMLRLVENRTTGIFNATGPTEQTSMQNFLEHGINTLNTKATPQWASDQFLLEHQVGPYVEMPLWIPGEANGMSRTDISRALKAGLTFRPIAETLRDTLEWFRGTERFNGELRAGLKEEKERALLEELKDVVEE